MKINKRKLAITVGIPLSIIFLFLALRKVDLNETFNTLKETNYLYIIPGILAFIIDFSLRAFRWKYLLEPIKKCRFFDLQSIVFIGFFSNSILPMRMGEIIRALMVGEKEEISKTGAIATIAVERVLDGFAIIILLIAPFFVFSFPDNIKKIWILGLLLFSIFIALFYGLMYSRSITLKILHRIFKIFPNKFEHKIEKTLDSFLSGLEILKKTHHLGLTLLISLCIWTADASVFYLIAAGMGISEVTFLGAVFIMAVISLGISIPSSPGYIGVYEYFGVLACSIIGIEKSTALSFILLVHAIQLITLTVTGMFFLTREHISLIQLEKKAQKQAQ